MKTWRRVGMSSLTEEKLADDSEANKDDGGRRQSLRWNILHQRVHYCAKVNDFFAPLYWLLFTAPKLTPAIDDARAVK